MTDVKGALPRWAASGSQPAGSGECPAVARFACLAADLCSQLPGSLLVLTRGAEEQIGCPSGFAEQN